MAVAMTLPGLPSGLGATVIQANNVLLPLNDYVPIDWTTAQRLVNQAGRELYTEFPSGTQVNPSWNFYTRADMSGASAAQKTLVGVRSRVIRAKRTSLNTTNMASYEFPANRRIVDVMVWHAVEVTLTNGSKYTDVSFSKVGLTVFIDPETSQFIVPTNGYQGPYEAMSLALKPVAAGAPLWDPAYAALAGINPNSV